jgi:hypothetical protein
MPTVNHFGAIAARLKPKAHAIVAESIVDIRDSAKAHSRVDKGEMRDGWTAEQTSDTAGSVYNDVPHTAPNEYGTVKMTAPIFNAKLARIFE